jgi:hypothetical protein
MTRYARIDDGQVQEIIDLPEGVRVEDAFYSEFVSTLVPVDSGDVAQGWAWDGTSFIPPDPTASELEVRARRQFSFLEFIELFTEEEQLTLVEASMTLPAIKLWYDRALGAQFIDLDDPRTEPGLQKLVDENLITTERKTAVLAGHGPEAVRS